MTVECLERDRSGRLTPLLAALDAHVYAEIKERTKTRKRENPQFNNCVINMETISHGELTIFSQLCFLSLPNELIPFLKYE